MNTAIIVSILYSIAVLFLLIAAYFFLGYRREKKEWSQEVGQWFPDEERKSIISRLGARFDEREGSIKLRNKLKGANLNLLPSEYVGILVVSFMALFVVLSRFFSLPTGLSFFLPLGLIFATHHLLFYFRKNSYENRFNEQLADVCRVLGNAARSGLTIQQGLEIVAREVDAPAKDEFRRIVNELRLGVSLESAFRSVQKRNTSREFNLFIATLLIQRRTGGNLALTLETMANTFEDRKVLMQTIKTMTAEHRYVSFLVPALPVFLLLIMNNVIDGFIDPLWSGIGLIILIIFLATITLSFFIIRKITDIKV